MKTFDDLIDKTNSLISSRIAVGTAEFKLWYQECSYFLECKYGKDSSELHRFFGIQYQKSVYVLGRGYNESLVRDTIDGLKLAINLFQLLKENDETKLNKAGQEFETDKIFIVYGHDNELKDKVIQIIKKQSLQPIAIDQQGINGLTIIEAIEKYSDCGSAICLFTGDDLCIDNGHHNYRPRQNVVFETGFFYGKLGRERTIIVKKDDIEMPSDLNGIIYSGNANFEVDLLKKLKKIGFKIDFNKQYLD